MAWIYRGDVNLPQADRDNNAWELYNYFKPLGWVDESLAAMCGNFDVESTINPQRINPNSHAYGLGQWLTTRKTRMIDYVTNTLGFSDWGNGIGQTKYIEQEWLHPSTYEGWYKRGGYNRTFNQFSGNTENDSLEDLAYMFQMCYERVSIGKPVPVRYRRTQYYYQLFKGGPGPGPGPGPGELPPLWLLFRKGTNRRVKRTIYI